MESNQVFNETHEEQKEKIEQTEQNEQTEQIEIKEETQEKFQDSEKDKLNKMEIIQFYSNGKKSSENKYNCIFTLFLILLLSVSISLCIFYFINNKDFEDKNYNLQAFKDKKEEKNKFEIKKENDKKEDIKQQNNEDKIKIKDNKLNIQKKSGIGFLYPSITEFMITTGEFLLKLKKYNLFFLTKSNLEKEYKYNSNIIRVNAYYDRKVIEKTVKNENIKYLILNEVFDEKEIKWLQTLNIKLIGIFDDIFMSKTTKNDRNLKIIRGYNAFIQDSIQDFDNYKKFNINKNIFIPNFYKTQKMKLSNLNNHNIILLGKINDIKDGVITALNSMVSIIKEFPDVKLKIISPDSQTLKIRELMNKHKLHQNVIFLPFNTTIDNNMIDSSIFIYTSLISNIPIALEEAMGHGFPCIISSEITKNLIFKDGIIKVDINKEKELTNEIIKLLKDNKYKNKIGMNSKSSLDKINDDILNIWDNLFIALNNGEKDFQNLRNGVEFKYNKKEIEQTAQEVKNINLSTQKNFKNIENKKKDISASTVKEKNISTSATKEKKDISVSAAKEKKDQKNSFDKEKMKVIETPKKSEKNIVVLNKKFQRKKNK